MTNGLGKTNKNDSATMLTSRPVHLRFVALSVLVERTCLRRDVNQESIFKQKAVELLFLYVLNKTKVIKLIITYNFKCRRNLSIFLEYSS